VLCVGSGFPKQAVSRDIGRVFTRKSLHSTKLVPCNGGDWPLITSSPNTLAPGVSLRWRWDKNIVTHARCSFNSV